MLIVSRILVFLQICVLLLAVAAASAMPQKAVRRTVRRRVASPSPSSQVRSARQVVREEPIQIVRSVYNAPSGTDQVGRKEKERFDSISASA